jgi:hypothetical protein
VRWGRRKFGDRCPINEESPELALSKASQTESGLNKNSADLVPCYFRRGEKRIGPIGRVETAASADASLSFAVVILLAELQLAVLNLVWPDDLLPLVLLGRERVHPEVF